MFLIMLPPKHLVEHVKALEGDSGVRMPMLSKIAFKLLHMCQVLVLSSLLIQVLLQPHFNLSPKGHASFAPQLRLAGIREWPVHILKCGASTETRRLKLLEDIALNTVIKVPNLTGQAIGGEVQPLNWYFKRCNWMPFFDWVFQPRGWIVPMTHGA